MPVTAVLSVRLLLEIQVVPRKCFFRPESDYSQGVFYLEVIVMRCPFCGDSMEKGLIQGGNLLVWVKKKHYFSLLPKEGEVILDRDYLTGSAIPAWICKKCKKLIAEYTEDNTEF